MSAPPWTDEERAWARECRDAGDTIPEIADASNRTVDDVACELGEVLPRGRGRPPGPCPGHSSGRIGKLAKVEVERLLREKLSLAAVADRADVSRQRIHQFAKELGLTRRRA